ncbi:glycosyl hydrolase, BNR repeat protein, partial [mine drainage metagenome]
MTAGLRSASTAVKTRRYLDEIPIEEFYSVDVAPGIPFWICGGIQDNNAWCGPSSEYNRGAVTGSDWFIVAGGDGQYAVPAPSDPKIIYADSQNGFIERYNRMTGRSHFIVPTYSGFMNTHTLSRQ